MRRPDRPRHPGTARRALGDRNSGPDNAGAGRAWCATALLPGRASGTFLAALKLAAYAGRLVSDTLQRQVGRPSDAASPSAPSPIATSSQMVSQQASGASAVSSNVGDEIAQRFRHLLQAPLVGVRRERHAETRTYWLTATRHGRDDLADPVGSCAGAAIATQRAEHGTIGLVVSASAGNAA